MRISNLGSVGRCFHLSVHTYSLFSEHNKTYRRLCRSHAHGQEKSIMIVSKLFVVFQHKSSHWVLLNFLSQKSPSAVILGGVEPILFLSFYTLAATMRHPTPEWSEVLDPVFDYFFMIILYHPLEVHHL